MRLKKKVRVGGRSAQVRENVHSAVMQLLSKKSLSEISVLEISKLSGVHATSIYRRWGTLEALFLEACLGLIEKESPLPINGTLRARLVSFALQVAQLIDGPFGPALLKSLVCLAGETPGDNVRLHSLVLPHLKKRVDEIQAMLTDQKKPPRRQILVEDILNSIIAPLYIRYLFGLSAVDTNLIGNLVDKIIDSPLQSETAAWKKFYAVLVSSVAPTM